MLSGLTGLLGSLKDFSPLPLAIIGLIALGYSTTTVIEGNTAALTRLVVLHEKLSNQEEQIMRRLDLLENLMSRR
jgi:hypothetical protein